MFKIRSQDRIQKNDHYSSKEMFVFFVGRPFVQHCLLQRPSQLGKNELLKVNKPTMCMEHTIQQTIQTVSEILVSVTFFALAKGTFGPKALMLAYEL